MRVYTDSLKRNRTISAPIRRVPPEILTLIFQNCGETLIGVDFSKFYTGSSEITPKAAPLVLSRVCHLWRRIALGTPSLWTLVDIGEDTFTSLNTSLVIPAFLAASADLPLQINMRMDLGEDESRRAMDLVQDALPRCRILSLENECQYRFLGTFMTEIGLEPMLHLETLAVSPNMLVGGSSYNDSYHHYDARFHGEAIDAPNLHTAALFGIPPEFMPSSPHLSSLNLVFTEPVSQADLLQRLSRYPQLLQLTMTAKDLEGTTDGLNVTFESLVSMKLSGGHSPATAVIFLQALDLPSIRELRLEFHIAYDEHFGVSSLANLNLLSNLTTFTLVLFNLCDISSISARLHNLETLRMRRCSSLDVALNSLSEMSDGWACPRLRRLEIDCEAEERPKFIEALFIFLSVRGGFRKELDAGHPLPYPLELIVINKVIFTEVGRTIDTLAFA